MDSACRYITETGQFIGTRRQRQVFLLWHHFLIAKTAQLLRGHRVVQNSTVKGASSACQPRSTQLWGYHSVNGAEDSVRPIEEYGVRTEWNMYHPECYRKHLPESGGRIWNMMVAETPRPSMGSRADRQARWDWWWQDGCSCPTVLTHPPCPNLAVHVVFSLVQKDR